MNITAQIEALGLNAYIAKKHINKIANIEIGSDNRIYIELVRGYNNGNDGIIILCKRSELRYYFKQVREGLAQKHRAPLTDEEVDAFIETSQAETKAFDERMAALDLQDAELDAKIEASFTAAEKIIENATQEQADEKARKEYRKITRQVEDMSDAEIEEIVYAYEDSQIVFESLGIKYSEKRYVDFEWNGMELLTKEVSRMVAATILKMTINYLIESREIIKYI